MPVWPKNLVCLTSVTRYELVYNIAILGGILHQSYVFSGRYWWGLSIKTRFISGVVFNKISILEIIQELSYFVKAKTTIDFANHTQNFNNYMAWWKASIVDNSQTTELVFPVYLLLFWIGEEWEEERKLFCSKKNLGIKVSWLDDIPGWYIVRLCTMTIMYVWTM